MIETYHTKNKDDIEDYGRSSLEEFEEYIQPAIEPVILEQFHIDEA
jgi:hypothetical protein